MSVKVSLSGDGLNYSTDADVVQAAKIIGFLNMDESLQASVSGGYVSTSNDNFIETPKKLQKSPREAIIESGAKTNVQKILVLGNFIMGIDSSETFAQNELKSIFVKAGEPAPKNLSRDVEAAVRQGYIFESPDITGQFIITNTGMKALDQGFAVSQNHKKSSQNKTSLRSKSKAPSKPEWLKSISVIDRIEGFRSYRHMNTRSEKCLWILQWGALNNHEWLTGSEIASIADELSTSVPNRQIAAAMAPHLARDYVSKSSDGYKILHEGTQSLKLTKAE